MDKKKIYDFCKILVDSKQDWFAIHKEAVKNDIVTKYVDCNELRNIYRDCAAELACGLSLPEVKDYGTYEKSFFSFINKKPSRFPVRKKVENSSNRETILVIADLHVPYEDKVRLKKIVDEWAGKADKLVIAGDFLNGSQLSRYPKMIVENFKEEVAKGRLVLEYLASKFNEVVLLDDNHISSRWSKFISNTVTPDLFFLTVHPYDYLCAGLPNVIRAGNTFEKFQEQVGWMYVIGDCVIAHGEVSSVVEMKPVRRVQEYYGKWRHALNLPEGRVFIQGHNHSCGLFHDTDGAVIFPGALVSLDGVHYAMGPEMRGRPPIPGYCVIVQEDGKTILEEIIVKRV